MYFRSIMPGFFILGFSLLFTACDNRGSNDEDDLPVPRVVAEGDYTVTPSGLKYFDFAEGSGAAASPDDFVSVHYHGWLTDGALFDSSILRGSPIQFFLGQKKVIQGWDEGIQGMRVGGLRQLVIPPSLGYGASGNGPIPPNATLIFEVELVSL